MDLEIRHLRLVAGIADAGSMTKAARALHLTQSALSHQLRDIEGRLGTALFTRLGRSMLLTEPGRRVLDAARRVLGEVQRAEDDVRRLAGHGEGTVRVCTQCYTGYHWLGAILQAFQAKHPRVTVNVVPDETGGPVEALLEGRIDLAILIDPEKDRRLRLRPLFTDEMVAIVPKEHPLARRPWIAPEALAREHLLLYSSKPDDSFAFRRILRPNGLVPARASFIMLTEAMIELARAGAGVGILPRWSAQRAIASGAVAALSITRRGMRRQWAAATLAAHADPPFLSDFIDLVAERALPVRTRARATA